MKVRVRLFSHLKDIAGESGWQIEVADGTTADGLLAELYARHPRLRDWDSSLLIAAGVEFVQRDYVVQPSDEISIMPPVQGG